MAKLLYGYSCREEIIIGLGQSHFARQQSNNLAIKPSTASPAFHSTMDGGVKGTKTFPKILNRFG
jgi:hypothetical protein